MSCPETFYGKKADYSEIESIMNNYNLKIHQMNVKTSFLNGDHDKVV
jgi:hypothetical protein